MATTFHADGSYSNTERVEDIELSNKNKTAQKAGEQPAAAAPKRAARRAPRASTNALDLNKLRSSTKKAETEKKDPAPAVEVAKVEKTPTVQPPVAETVKEAAPTPVAETVKEAAPTPAEEPVVAPKAEVHQPEETAAPKLEVSGVIKEIKLDAPSVEEPTESGAFDVVSLDALCAVAKTSLAQLDPWARKCCNKYVTSPDTVFGFGNSGLKLYSIRHLGSDTVLILGCEDSITAASYSFDTSSFTDKGSKLSFDGDVVCYNGKAVITTAYKNRPVRGV